MTPLETDSPHYELLRRCAAAQIGVGSSLAVESAAASEVDWGRFVGSAELHGLSPLAYKVLKPLEQHVPVQTLMQLRALYLRHRSSSEIRTQAASEIVHTLGQHNIPVLLLKGIALCQLIYSEPGLRPMRDIDLLVPVGQRLAARDHLRRIGFETAPSAGIRDDHHHLPPVAKSTEGLSVSVEIHDDAIAPDNVGSIRLDNLSDPPYEFQLSRCSAYTLGPVDMLRHLCRHTVEPQRVVKLGSVFDTLAYADRYAESIDWAAADYRFPSMVVTLRMFGYLLGWPKTLGGYLAEPQPPSPRGLGVGMAPLSEIARSGHRLRHLLDPSDWWLHAYYGVPAGRSLLPTKTASHPIRLAQWLCRRALHKEAG